MRHKYKIGTLLVVEDKWWYQQPVYLKIEKVNRNRYRGVYHCPNGGSLVGQNGRTNRVTRKGKNKGRPRRYKFLSGVV